MSFDGLFTKAMTEELQQALMGGRITKIHQPFKNELIIHVRAQGKNKKLLLSAHPSYARAQLTNEPYENPKEPPMFCMLLRKHLEGYFIQHIKQIDTDRIIVIDVQGRNEIGDLSSKQLYIEIMGRHSNIVLVDPEQSQPVILDSIKHVPAAMNSYRTILPGFPYHLPPKQEKENPLDQDEESVRKWLDFNAGKLDKQIVQHFSGVSPLIAKEIISRDTLANTVTVPRNFVSVMNDIKQKNYKATITVNQNRETFYMLDLHHLQGDKIPFSSLSEMLDRFYYGKAERDRVKQQAHDLERFITNERTKNVNKIGKLETTIQEAEDAQVFQLLGELLTANIYAAKRGMEHITVPNYYEEGTPNVTIELDPRKTPSENAQKYFAKYQKAKTARVIVREQIMKTKEEITYFETLMQQMESASPRDIEEIRQELIEEGYIQQKKKKVTKQKNAQITVEKYIASDETEILVGKNNKQNDYLTHRLARKNDIWLHTKDIPGSHVIIRSEEPSEQTILEAAMIAAYFSKAKDSSSVPVDWTYVRYVKKPSGAKPGFVTYDHQQTIYTTPNVDKILSLRKKG